MLLPHKDLSVMAAYMSPQRFPNLVYISEVLEFFSCMTRQKRMPCKTIHEVVDFRSGSCLRCFDTVF